MSRALAELTPIEAQTIIDALIFAKDNGLLVAPKELKRVERIHRKMLDVIGVPWRRGEK